jgi:hypothetical protein
MAITYQSLRPTAQAPAVVVLYLHLHLHRLRLEELLGVKILSGRRSITVPAWRLWKVPPPGNAPPSVNLHIGAPEALVQALRKHAIKHIEPEVLRDRRDMWDGEDLGGP